MLILLAKMRSEIFQHPKIFDVLLLFCRSKIYQQESLIITVLKYIIKQVTLAEYILVSQVQLKKQKQTKNKKKTGGSAFFQTLGFLPTLVSSVKDNE